MRTRPIICLIAATAAGVLVGCGTSTGEDSGSEAMATSSASASPAATTGGTATPPAGETMVAGAYLTAAEYGNQMAAREGTAVVYCFHAPWCPDCRATEKAIEATACPAGLTVVKVDFDPATDLRREAPASRSSTPSSRSARTASSSRSGPARGSGAEIKAKTV